MQKLIEAALPLSEINEKAIREKKGMSGHPANLHLWWGRSPVSSVQSALAASLIDAPESEEELLERLRRVQKGTIPEFGQKPTVFDPFCGFGGIPLAAQSLGLNVVAGDLNPVAVMLTKAAAEIPAMFAGCGPVNPSAFQNSSFSTERACRGRGLLRKLAPAGSTGESEGFVPQAAGGNSLGVDLGQDGEMPQSRLRLSDASFLILSALCTERTGNLGGAGIPGWENLI